MVSQYFHPRRLLKQNCFLLFQNAQKTHRRWLDYRKAEQNSCCLSRDVLEFSSCHKQHVRHPNYSQLFFLADRFRWKGRTSHCAPLAILWHFPNQFIGSHSIGCGVEYPCRRIPLYLEIRIFFLVLQTLGHWCPRAAITKYCKLGGF